jgi:hypothetical protein
MLKTRNKLLVTLVLMTVAVAVVCPTHVSARPNTQASRSSTVSTTPPARSSAVVLNGEPDSPGNTAPAPGVIPVTLQPGDGSGTPHSVVVPVSSLAMWAGWIWAARFGVVF